MKLKFYLDKTCREGLPEEGRRDGVRGGANNEEGRGEGVNTHDEDEAPFTKTMSPKLEN